MKKLVVGDIHACFDEFMELIKVAGITDEDEIYPLGDIVDRGPESKKTLDWCRRHPNVHPVRGNHERKHIRGVDDPTFKLARSQTEAKKEFTEAEYKDAVNYMRTLPLYIELPEAMLVHGMWEPGVHVKAQKEEVLVGTIRGSKDLERKLGGPQWYDVYDGLKPIIVGHLVYNKGTLTGTPLIREGRVYAIDTAACHGFRLTGVVLPGFEIVSVPTKKDYWSNKKG